MGFVTAMSGQDGTCRGFTVSHVRWELTGGCVCVCLTAKNWEVQTGAVPKGRGRGKRRLLEQMDFRIVFFELLLLLLLLLWLFLEHKCNYVELNMSFTLFFKIYAHVSTVCLLLLWTHRSARCVCLQRKWCGCVPKDKIKIKSKKATKSKVSMYNKSSFNLPDSVIGHDFASPLFSTPASKPSP